METREQYHAGPQPGPAANETLWQITPQDKNGRCLSCVRRGQVCRLLATNIVIVEDRAIVKYCPSYQEGSEKPMRVSHGYTENPYLPEPIQYIARHYKACTSPSPTERRKAKGKPCPVPYNCTCGANVYSMDQYGEISIPGATIAAGLHGQFDSLTLTCWACGAKHYHILRPGDGWSAVEGEGSKGDASSEDGGREGDGVAQALDELAAAKGKYEA